MMSQDEKVKLLEARAENVLAEIKEMLAVHHCRIVVQKQQGGMTLDNGAWAEGDFYAWAVEALDNGVEAKGK